MKMIHPYVQVAQDVQLWNAVDLDQTAHNIRIPMKFISEGMDVVKLSTTDDRVTSKKMIIKY